METSAETDVGYILNVDIEYGSENSAKFECHDGFPLLPEKVVVEESDLSPFTRNLMRETGAKMTREPKLIASLRDKKSYTLHLAHLKFVLAHGLKLKRVNAVLEFQQRPIFKEYVERIVRLRRESRTASEKNCWKIVLNSLYGRMLLDSQNFVNCRVVRGERHCAKLVNSKLYRKHTVVSPNLVLVYSTPPSVTYATPILIGGTILCLSKLVQSYYFYERVQRCFAKPELVFSDTDSVCFMYTEEEAEYRKARESMGDVFDFSSFEPSDELYSDARKACPGFYKAELPYGSAVKDSKDRISLFYGSCAKMYCLQSVADSQIVKAKGVPFCLRRSLGPQTYHEAIFNNSITQGTYNKIVSYNHVLHTAVNRKRLLTLLDFKRYWLKCGLCSISLFRDDSEQIDKAHVCPYLAGEQSARELNKNKQT